MDDLLSNVERVAVRHGAEMAKDRHFRFEMIAHRGRLVGEAKVDLAWLTGALWGFLGIVKQARFAGIESISLQIDGVEFGPGLDLVSKCEALERWLVGGGEAA